MFEQYRFSGGFPTPETIERAYYDSDLVRAIEAYKFFFQMVLIAGVWKAGLQASLIPNKALLLERGTPNPLVLIPNSDIPHVGASIDLSNGPVIVELPPGPLIGVVNDLHQQCVMNMGLGGPDGGLGGKHLILPPGDHGPGHGDYLVGTSSTHRALLTLRALPPQGDMEAALSLLNFIKIYPLDDPEDWDPPERIDGTRHCEVSRAHDHEDGLFFWQELHEAIDRDPPLELHRVNYDQLALLGIEKGRPFAPDERMRDILECAARIANAQMRVESFAGMRPERIGWPDRRWEAVNCLPDGATAGQSIEGERKVQARIFHQAGVESQVVFRRDPGAGSLYWLGTRDGDGAYLDGARSYRLTVPLPVPAMLFWSLTVYDAATCREIETEQDKAAFSSLVDLRNVLGSKISLRFGPTPPADIKARWIQTLPGKGWFAFFQIYRPHRAAFDRSWRPGDFECVG